MSALEQRKVLCSVTFHLVAITCVLWSLYVLIERTSEEMRDGQLDWPFWTKLIVVAVGFTGGLVFMYVQLRMYLQLFKRWKAFNRIIFVQNAPSKDKDLPTAKDLMPVNIVMPSSADGSAAPSSVDSRHQSQQSHHSSIVSAGSQPHAASQQADPQRLASGHQALQHQFAETPDPAGGDRPQSKRSCDDTSCTSPASEEELNDEAIADLKSSRGTIASDSADRPPSL